MPLSAGLGDEGNNTALCLLNSTKGGDKGDGTVQGCAEAVLRLV